MKRLLLLALVMFAQDEKPRAFRRIVLSEQFTCEGANAGDFNKDGTLDIAAGPYWYEGPDFAKKHEIYEPKTFDPMRYSNNFFAWAQDFNGDGWEDLLVAGFPGADASWFENPRSDARWTRHVVVPNLDNESPAWADVTGDGRRELVGQVGGSFGYCEWDPKSPEKPWTFRAISPKGGRGAFTHGLGVGDVNGDGRVDLLEANGWWEQPKDGGLWTHHPAQFGGGGAQMFATDVDGDGDADVVTSLAAHGFGLAWFEQSKDGWTPHVIMGDKAAQNPHGVRFGELHALDLVDMDGDGLQDIVTGKRWWSHGPKGDVDGGPAVVYWFKLVREGGVRYEPRLIDDASGVGTQVIARDVDGDSLVDVIVGNKKGAFVLKQEAAGPRRVRPPVNVDLEAGTLRDWTAEGAAFERQPVRGDTVFPRRNDMRSDHAGEYWIGTYEIAGDGPQGTLTSAPFKVLEPWASFLVAGGSHAKTCVEVVRADTKKTIFKASGDDTESLKPVVVDLREHVGREILLRVVDGESGGWGHVNFDDFTFWTARPKLPNERRGTGPPPPDEVRHAGLAAADAAKAMTLRDGFNVTLVASEPDIRQPVAMAIDDRGRIWIAEGHTYPVRAPGDKGLDRIVILEDADGDGRAEKQTVFAERLNLVSGLEVGFGGVWVGAAPYLMFIPDRDRDDKPDGPPEVLLDGWGWQDTHETLNAFIWGPDGWLYGCHGVFTHSLVGRPGAPRGERTPINAGIWRYHPTKRIFEVFAEGTSNPWGVDFDDRGQAFATACVIPHLYHLAQGGRYTRQAGAHFNPYVFEDIPTIADHVHYAGNRGPHGGNNRSDAAGGGHAHCGAMIYLGDQWPAEYRGAIFMGNVHGNRINMDVPERRGSTFVARHGADLLLSNDRWFRMINLRCGPDGSVYFIDWYDKVPCHTTDPRANDRGNGRVYRLSYGVPKPARVDLAKLSDDELVGLQQSRCDWYVRHARRLLQERGLKDRSKLAALAPRSLRALWAMHVTGGVDESMLASEDADVRAWAVQLLCEDRKAPAGLARLAREDPSPVVRLYAACALQRLPVESRWEIVEGLVARPEDDPPQALMVWYGFEPLVAADAKRALAIAAAAKTSKLLGFAVRRCESLDAVVPLLDGPRAGEVLSSLALALRGKRRVAAPAGWEEAAAKLAKSPDADVRFMTAALSVKFGVASPRLLADIARDARAPADRRTFALTALVESKDASTPEVARSLLSDAAMRLVAIRALASLDDAKAPPALLEAYAGWSPEERKAALATLSSRLSYARPLVEAVRSGRLAKKELTADVVRQLSALGDAEIDAAVAELWGAVRSTPEDRRKEIDRFKALVRGPGRTPDPVAGRATYVRTCMQCHTLFGMGEKLGPDLTGSNRADLDYLFENIVDPNALVPNEYKTTVVTTKDGQVVVGIVLTEGRDSMTLATSTQTVTVALEDVKERRPGQLSIMPEGQLKGMSDEEVRDLAAYLASPSQVPMAADKDTVGRFFNGRDLALWDGDAKLWSVENGEIVGRSRGLKRNEFLVSHLEVRDFRLTLDVKLAPDGGNSGIQFRSAVTSDGMRGPQADIGAGWWGKLYDEEGRGLLWDRPGDGHVKKGDWNLYEIVAVGGRVKTAINGKPCVDLDDAKLSARGVIAFQLHAGGAFEVRFRNLRLETATECELRTVK